MADKRKVAILLFDDVEVLDFAGPFEVLSVSSSESWPEPFHTFTVAESRTIRARNGLSVNPDYLLGESPPPDVLVVPGGIGTRKELNNQRLLDWISEAAANAEVVTSVCTGALLLGKLGLLDGLDVTTHHVAYDLLREIAPNATVHEGRRYIDNGKVITAAGISAGIDMSLHVVQRLLGSTCALATASQMEYPWEGSEDEPNAS